MQMGFMLKRGTIDGIFITRQMMAKYVVARRKLCMMFLNLEKALIISQGKSYGGQ